MFYQKLRPLFKLKNVGGYFSESNQSIKHRTLGIVSSCYNSTKNKQLPCRMQPPFSAFCTQKLPKSADIFGDISGRKFEHVDMDELEQQEEKFQDSEGAVPRRFKLSLGQYANTIKSHISKKDLSAALKVLDLIKENRDKPTMYIYNLLIRAYSKQGDIKQCFKLYTKAKSYGLQPNAATYVSLFNACAISRNTTVALEYLNNLRKSMYQQQFVINNVHYNAMLKAYSWHKQIFEAFQLVDEMRDKRMLIGESTYNSLFHATISDKEAGLRHALIVWHLMRIKKIKPSLTTYNLFLRAIRDTKLGNLKPDDILISEFNQTKISLQEGEKPDLLASPPVLTTLLSVVENKEGVNSDIVDTNASNISQPISIDLNNILVNNRLILFGGMEGFLDRMAKDNITPDAKTMTLLLDVIPNTTFAEDLLVKIADEKKIALNIDFCNMLIKKRSMRFDYKAAKEVISMAEQRNLSANVMTFGVLALGCQGLNEVKEFLQGIEAFGYRPNAVIMSTLINTACHKKDLKFLVFVMNYMVENRYRPNARAVKDLEAFSKTIYKIEKPIGRYRLRRRKRLEDGVEKFKEHYPKWQKMIRE